MGQLLPGNKTQFCSGCQCELPNYPTWHFPSTGLLVSSLGSLWVPIILWGNAHKTLGITKRLRMVFMQKLLNSNCWTADASGSRSSQIPVVTSTRKLYNRMRSLGHPEGILMEGLTEQCRQLDVSPPRAGGLYFRACLIQNFQYFAEHASQTRCRLHLKYLVI